jgi:hypothetical protein
MVFPFKNGVKQVLKAGVLAVALLSAGCGREETTFPAEMPPSVAAPTAEPVASQSFTRTAKEMLMADFTLYRVDCATKDTGIFPTGFPAGLCQSQSDMPYGEDPVTKLYWGYHGSPDILSEEDSLGEGITAFKWVVSKDASDPSKAGICYDFSVPDGNYTVTLGFYNPFGVRKISVECEGKTEIKAEKILRYNVNEKSFEAKVTDGILNLKVCNPDAHTFMESPILSYITIASEPEYTRELLSAAVESMRVDNAAELYTEKSVKSYLSALEAAEKFLSKESNNGVNQIKQKFKDLRESYKMLTKKYKYDSFNPGAVWTDTEGTPIQAHGGQVQQLEIPDPETGKISTKWVWVGEDKTHGYRGGVCAYTSDDLYNWKFEGIIMRNVPSRRALEKEEYFKNLYAGYSDAELDNVALALDAERAVIERPKLIYNEKNRQYVLWFHADGPTATSDSNYAAACAGVAVSDTPFGPYRFVGRYRLNTCPPDQEDKHPQSKGMARDMNLFKDTDGTAYIIYSSEENLTLYISKLNEDYTYLETEPEKAVYGKDFIRLFPGAQREAPALFLKDGRYYLMTSGCTGWAPNQARYYVADSVMGEWTSKGDPCIGDSNHTTFESQSTCIFLDVNSGTWIYMGDRWFADTLNDSRYIWLPIVFKDNGDMEISFVSNWKLR